MKVLLSLFKIITNKLTIIDCLTDLRTISVAALVVGGVSRFFGVHNPLYVIILAFITWVACIISINKLRK